MSIAAIAAGYILDKLHAPINFTLCFLLTSGGLILSYIALGSTASRLTAGKVDPWNTSLPPGAASKS